MKVFPYAWSFARMRRPVGWLLAIAVSATAFAAIAVQDAQGQQAANADCAGLRDAAKNAMNNHLLIVDSFMKGATESMQNAVSTKNSCIGDVALADIDLSGMVPDFGLLGGLLSSAIDKLIKGAINKVCDEVNSVVQTSTGTWNKAVTDIGTELNLKGQVQTWARDVDYGVTGAINTNIGNTNTTRTLSPVAAPVICVSTLNGKICSDGKSSTDGALANAQTPATSTATQPAAGTSDSLTLPVRP